jgi:hypothetical protein
MLRGRVNDMKTRRLLRLIAAGALAVLIQGCATNPKSGSAAIVGTWANSIGTVWTIKTDGAFDVDLDRDSKRDGWGKYMVEDNTVTMWRTGGVKPKGCDGKGVYHFTRSEDGLQFGLVRDTCKLRKANLLLPWHSRK